MSVQKDSIEASVNLFEYSSKDIFTFKEVYQLNSTENKISFSVLLNIKKKDSSDCNISVALAYIKEELIEIQEDPKLGTRQRFLRLDLFQTTLSELSRQKPAASAKGRRLAVDAWSERHLLKLNFKDVPTKGKGSYALIVGASPVEGTDKTRKMLDCYYFDVV